MIPRSSGSAVLTKSERKARRREPQHSYALAMPSLARVLDSLSFDRAGFALEYVRTDDSLDPLRKEARFTADRVHSLGFLASNFVAGPDLQFEGFPRHSWHAAAGSLRGAMSKELPALTFAARRRP